MKMQRATITQFIKLYRERPCLWNNKLPEYTNKFIKYKALNELLEILKKIELNPTIDTVRKKIDNLRTIYNRERRKVVLSEASGCPPEMVYQPTLWYFNQMSFLNELDSPIGNLKQANLVEETSESVAENSEIVQNAHEDSEDDPPPPKRQRQAVKKVRQQKFLQKLKERDSGDELDCFGKMAAKTLRKLDEPTQAIALKLMSDVLYHAKMGHLNEQSGISIPTIKPATEVPCSTEQIAYIGPQTSIYRPESSNYNTRSPNNINESSNYVSKSPNYTSNSPIYLPTSPQCSPVYRSISPNYDIKPSVD